MWLLSFGVLLFCFTHLMPSTAPGIKSGLISRLDENRYKGLFSLTLLISIVCIVFGWRGAAVTYIYQPDPALRHLALGLIALAFLLMVAASRQTRLKRIVRHPQLTGVFLWASAHLLLNGDNRSLVLFGTLAAWSCIEIVTISRREGTWVKSDVPAWSSECVTVVIACVVLAVLIVLHPYFAGMPVLF
jgi:uncharacterized membrane protein